MPLKKLVVTLDESQRESLFDQFRQFANKHGFAIRIAPVTPDDKEFIVEMWRSDLKIFAVTAEKPGTFQIGIFDNDSEEIPQIYFEELIADLKAHLGNVQGATVADG